MAVTLPPFIDERVLEHLYYLDLVCPETWVACSVRVYILIDIQIFTVYINILRLRVNQYPSLSLYLYI